LADPAPPRQADKREPPLSRRTAKPEAEYDLADPAPPRQADKREPPPSRRTAKPEAEYDLADPAPPRQASKREVKSASSELVSRAPLQVGRESQTNYGVTLSP